MEFSNDDLERILDLTISNKKFYRRLLEYKFDINDVWHKLLTRPKPRRLIRLDDFYRNHQGMLAMTKARWLEKYEPERFKTLRDTINKLSSVYQCVFLTDREKYEIDIIKKRIYNEYEYDRDLLVREKYKKAKGKSPKTQAQCDTEALLPLFEDIWRITERINDRGLDAEGRVERYYKKDVEELLACFLQAISLAHTWALVSVINKDRDEAFKKALEVCRGMKRIKREPGSKPPYDAKYVHDRVYPP